MKGIWVGSLGVSLSLFAAGARGQDYQWRPARSSTPQSAAAETRPPAATRGRPIATLGRPVPMTRPAAEAVADNQVARTAYSAATLEPPRVVRAQAPEFGGP